MINLSLLPLVWSFLWNNPQLLVWYPFCSILVMDLSCQYWCPAMVFLESPMGEVCLLFFNVAPYSVNTLHILEHISWHLLWVLATNTFSWLVLASYVVLDVRHLLDRDILSEFLLWGPCCLGRISFLPCIPLHLLSMLVRLSFPMLGPPPSLLCCFFKSSWVYHLPLVLFFVPTS